MIRSAVRTVVVLGWALASGTGQAGGAESTSFLLGQDTTAGGGHEAQSISFMLSSSTGQESVTGLGLSSSFQLESGFWTSAAITREAAIEAAGSGSGQIQGSGFVCLAVAGSVSGDCDERAMHGTVVSVVAEPGANDFFAGWTGCDDLSTSVLPDDTCELTITRDLVATAEFIAGGGIDGLVWLDHNGDGVVDSGESGVAGVQLELDDGSSLIPVMTDSSGAYTLAGLFPGSYQLALDPGSVPQGSVPTYDPDGIQTPLTTGIVVAAGTQVPDLRFGFQPQADLAIVIDAESLSDGEIRFTVTVTNNGLADASNVQVTIDRSPAVTVSTSGCLEDPSAIPTCSLGTLLATDTAVLTILTRSQSSQATSVIVDVAVSALESDPIMENNNASIQGFVAIPVPSLRFSALAMFGLLVLLTALIANRQGMWLPGDGR